jgi:glyceraldehyde 3-phosphate dehydrogenase
MIFRGIKIIEKFTSLVMTLKVGINGFGRIGRLVLRQLMKMQKDGRNIDVVGINDLAPIETLAHLFEFDSVHGRFDGTVEVDTEHMILKINEDDFQTFSERDPSKLPWGKLNTDIVIECTGFFRDKVGMMKHLEAGAKKVILSAPGKDVDITIVMGVNDELYDKNKHNLISNASCTTNCLATTIKVLDDSFGYLSGTMTTIHAYTNDQNMLDAVHKDYRRMRAAAVNMIPTTTGASDAVGLVLPHLKGKIDGLAVRVPTPNASLVDMTCRLKGRVSKSDLEQAFRFASENNMKNILDYEWRSLVSSDFIGNPNSSIVDVPTLKVIEEADDSTLVKVLSWYDNEWGYSARTADLVWMIYEQGF